MLEDRPGAGSGEGAAEGALEAREQRAIGAATLLQTRYFQSRVRARPRPLAAAAAAAAASPAHFRVSSRRNMIEGSKVHFRVSSRRNMIEGCGLECPRRPRGRCAHGSRARRGAGQVLRDWGMLARFMLALCRSEHYDKVTVHASMVRPRALHPAPKAA
jgi:hypothetical protein